MLAGEGVEDGVKVKERATGGLLPPDALTSIECYSGGTTGRHTGMS